MEASNVLYYLVAGGAGVMIGGLATWLYWLSRVHRAYHPKEILTDYVSREVHEQLRSDADLNYENLQERISAETAVRGELARLQARHEHLSEKLTEQAREMERLQAQSVAHFERAADRLLEEKSERFSKQNLRQLDGLLSPLKERIQTFEDQIQKRYLDETKERVDLRAEIRNLHQLNQQISLEANNLAGALRGNTKLQGDWGEWQLLTLLEASGLQQGVHFSAQSSFTDDEGRQKRPDFIIHLPDEKHLVVDSKVSLTAYERYCSCDEHDHLQRRAEARNHLRSLRAHVADLAGKNYTRLYQINSPDYLLLFVPIEPALGLALQTDQQLFIEALQKNIVLVSPATLLATLRTVSYIWKQENQKRNVLEIARQSGMLYDNFVAFTQELQKIGHRLDQAQSSYQSAMTKLSTGGKYGATLIGRAEKLRKLGAKARRRIDRRLLEEE